LLPLSASRQLPPNATLFRQSGRSWGEATPPCFKNPVPLGGSLRRGLTVDPRPIRGPSPKGLPRLVVLFLAGGRLERFATGVLHVHFPRKGPSPAHASPNFILPSAPSFWFATLGDTDTGLRSLFVSRNGTWDGEAGEEGKRTIRSHSAESVPKLVEGPRTAPFRNETFASSGRERPKRDRLLQFAGSTLGGCVCPNSDASGSLAERI